MCYDSNNKAVKSKHLLESVSVGSFGMIEFTVVFKIREVGLSEPCN